MAVSQRQIAEKLGVSIALVSRVLSGKAAEIGITQDKIDQVVKTADEMGYVPSAAALSLIGKSTRTIGIAVYEFNDPFFGSLIKEIQIQAHQHNYSLVLTGFLNRIPDRQDLQALHKHKPDGLIVIGTDTNAQWLEDFTDMPVVRIGHGSDAETSTQVLINEVEAASDLLAHLIERHRRKMAFISADLPAHKIRKQAFQQAATDLGLRLETIQSNLRGSFQAGLEATRNVLQSNSNIDALVCATDRVAMGTLHALYDAGIPVPEQIAVTGFDDIAAASEFIPPITTIRQPVHEMVLDAFNAIQDPHQAAPSSHKGKLIVRRSS